MEEKKQVQWSEMTSKEKSKVVFILSTVTIIVIMILFIIFDTSPSQNESNNYENRSRSGQELQDSIDFINYGKSYKFKREQDPNYNPTYK